jgi:hypothetical protein
MNHDFDASTVCGALGAGVRFARNVTAAAARVNFLLGEPVAAEQEQTSL